MEHIYIILVIRDTFFLYKASRLFLRPNNSPFQWIPQAHSPQVKRPGIETGHSNDLRLLLGLELVALYLKFLIYREDRLYFTLIFTCSLIYS